MNSLAPLLKNPNPLNSLSCITLRIDTTIVAPVRNAFRYFHDRVYGDLQVVLGVVVFGVLFLAEPLVVNAGDVPVVLGVWDTRSCRGGVACGTAGGESAEASQWLAATRRERTADFLRAVVEPRTVSRFSENDVVVVEEIPFETRYEEDDDLEWGKEEKVQEGKEGERKLTYRISYWYGEEMGRELISKEVAEPTAEIIKRGTKIKWREVPGKGYNYWAKLEDCWATSYDGNCVGCRGLTYSGTKVKHGVCAVDPDVIPLGTNFYVPGYGICRAEDIGGAIDGNDVDLGFRDVRQGFWSARHVDVYLLTNAPE